MTIAQTMISAGYEKECIKIYSMIRKSIVDEVMYRLGFENLTLSQMKKLHWEVLDMKIQAWLSRPVLLSGVHYQLNGSCVIMSLKALIQ